MFFTGFQILPLYFDEQQFLATSILSVGPVAGVLLLSPSTQALLDHLDWRKTMKVLAGINLATCLLGCTITRKNITQNQPSLVRKRLCDYIRSIDVSLLKDPFFVILTISVTVSVFGDHLPFFHLVSL